MDDRFPDDPELDRLRERMGAADPAADLPAADRAAVARLLEDTMNTTPDSSHGSGHDSGRDSGARRRPLMAALAVAAAVVLLGGVGFLVFGNSGDDDSNVADDGGTSQTSEPTEGGSDDTTAASVMALTAPESVNGRCAAPTPGLIRDVVSFAAVGTVTAIDGDQVTLEVNSMLVGEEVQTITVTAPSDETNQLLLGVEFEPGEKYVVAGDDNDSLLICGLSAPYDEQIMNVYGKAFPIK